MADLRYGGPESLHYINLLRVEDRIAKMLQTITVDHTLDEVG